MNGPQPGDGLYSTCGACLYGEIVAVGEDANHVPTVDIWVYDPNDLIIMPSETMENAPEPREWPQFYGCTTLELPPGTRAILRHVQYKTREMSAFPDHHLDERGDFTLDKSKPLWRDLATGIDCKTPGDGCYRCTKSFVLIRRAAC